MYYILSCTEIDRVITSTYMKRHNKCHMPKHLTPLESMLQTKPGTHTQRRTMRTYLIDFGCERPDVIDAQITALHDADDVAPGRTDAHVVHTVVKRADVKQTLAVLDVYEAHDTVLTQHAQHLPPTTTSHNIHNEKHEQRC